MDTLIKDLRDNPISLQEFSSCLDRRYKCIGDWSSLAYSLDVPSDIIRKCGLYSEDSPTIRLFQYMHATNHGLSIKELKDALRDISRIDIYKLLVENSFKDGDTVSEAMSSDPTFMDAIALELDSATKPTSGWVELAKILKVSSDVYKKFAMYQDCNPTAALIHYLCVTRDKPISLREFVDCLNKMQREDVIIEVQKVVKAEEIDSLTINDVLKVDSELLQKIADRLNGNTVGCQGWRKLGNHLEVDSDILDRLEPPPEKEVHSPTTKVIEWLAAKSPSTTIRDIIGALGEFHRNDAIKILNLHYAAGDDVISALDDADSRVQATLPSQQVPYGIQATEHLTSNILQGDRRNFGIPLNTVKLIGREQEINTIVSHLTGSQYDMVILRAPLGMGKTSITYSIAHTIMQEPYGYTVVYVNHSKVFCLDDLAVKILTACGIPSPNDGSVSKVLRLFEAFERKCVLVIEHVDDMYHSMDGMAHQPTGQSTHSADMGEWEKTSAQHKRDFMVFIETLVLFSKNLKILITTWEHIDFPSLRVKHEPLAELNEDLSIELVKSKIDGVELDNVAVQDILHCCGGNPQLLSACATIMAQSGSPITALHHLSSSPAEVRLRKLSVPCLIYPLDQNYIACLDQCFKRMDPNARLVLLITSVFPHTFTKRQAQLVCSECEIRPDSDHDLEQTLEPLNLEDGLSLLQGYSFLTFHDDTQTYHILSSIRDFGVFKARTSTESQYKQVYDTAVRNFICITCEALAKKEVDFFSTNCKSAIQKYAGEAVNIRHIMRWCLVLEDCLEMEMKKTCITWFLDTISLFLVVMPSTEMKLALSKASQLCLADEDVVRYCACLVYSGAKNITGCLCSHMCFTALRKALWFFCEVDNVLRDATRSKIAPILPEETRAEFDIKYGRCKVRVGQKDEGLAQIKEGIEKRGMTYKRTQSPKHNVMVAAGYNDLAEAHSFTREYQTALEIREKHVLPVYNRYLGIHPFTASACSHNASDYLALGRYDEAIKASQTALFYQRSLLGAHQETAGSLFDIGHILSEQASEASAQAPELDVKKDYEKALFHLQEALQMQQLVLDSPEETAKTHQELVFVFEKLGRPEEAEEHKQEIAKCMKKMNSAYERETHEALYNDNVFM